MCTVGVLALQGAFAKHLQMLAALGVDGREVRNADELTSCDALIIPGGESTAILRLVKAEDLLPHLVSFGESHPVFGTCAGLILMAREIVAEPSHPLGWLNVSVERNAYSRQ